MSLNTLPFEIFTLFTVPLAEHKVPYVITGSVAAIFYEEPRLTLDIDIVIGTTLQTIKQFSDIFPEPEFYTPPRETLLSEAGKEQNGAFNVIHVSSGFKADFFLCGEDEFFQWAVANGRTVDFQQNKVIIAPPEYVIIKKLQYYHKGKPQKHLTDIQRIVRQSGSAINFLLLENYINRFAVADEWRMADNAKNKHVQDNTCFNPEFPTSHLSGEEKLIQSLNLYFLAWEMKKAGLKMQLPELSDEALEKKVAEIFMKAGGAKFYDNPKF